MATVIQSEVRKVVRCLIITDSRGKRLDEYLESHGQDNLDSHRLNIIAEVSIQPGLKLEHCRREITRLCLRHRTPFDLIILTAGICSLTDRDAQNRTLSYCNRAKKDNIVEWIDSLIAEFQDRLHIATIAPADLHKYSASPHNAGPVDINQYLEQQKNLTTDCQEINDHIIAININRRQPTIPWAKQCMLTSKKRDKRTKRLRTITKFCANHLYDGLHPDEHLRDVWFKLVVQHIAKVTTQEDEDQGSQDESAQESQEESSQEEGAAGDTWNFKRPRTS